MKKYTFLILFLSYTLFGFSQNARTPITIIDKQVSVSSYTNMEVTMNNQSDLHLTATMKPLNNSIINLNSVDSWVFFDNIRPSKVIDSLLQYIYINNQAAVLKTNVRVSIYKHGAVVIPQSSSFKPLTVYTNQNFSGDSAAYSLFTYNNALSSFDNKIRSFKLKRGYMATLATGTDGLGYNRVFIADDKDLEISVLPTLLDNSISFIRVFEWEWVTKKGWCGTASTDLDKLNATWCYDWSGYASTTAISEYVPMHAKLTWAPFSQINALQNVTHSLGFNEPDHAEQHQDDNGGKALTVSQALAQWPDMLKSGLRVGAPACTDFSWLYSFMDSCNAHNYRVDYVAVHAYWGGKSPQNWYNDLKYIHDRTGRPIWITEWNNGANWTTETWPTSDKSLSALNAAKQLADLKGILTVLDTASFIERYSIYNWVQDCRAVILADTLTPAGKYYSADKSAMAFNKTYEVIPSFNFNAPSLAIAFSTTKLTLNITDPNVECFNGFALEKKTDAGTYTEIYRSQNSSLKQYSDTLDINANAKVRYRVRSILRDGTISNYSNEVGFDVANGNDIQYGNLSFSNVGWNPVFFKKGFSNTNLPAIILGGATNSNSTVLLTPRPKLISATTRFSIQLAPWSYQNVTSLVRDESVPYFIIGPGNYNFSGLTAEAGKVNINSAWTAVTFAKPFDSIPVVFMSQLSPSSINATVVRVRNVSKTGFEARLQKESAIKVGLSLETVSYFAITPGTGIIDNKKVIVGKTANNAISPITYTKINYGDSIAKPIFLAQLQTCNDDTVTATLRCITVSSKYANVMKQRERSCGVTIASTESAGWMLINPTNINDGLNPVKSREINVYPNPVADYLYFNQPIDGTIKVDIYSMYGILVMSEFLSENRINVKKLVPGYYLIKTSNKLVAKFIKL